MRITIIFQGLIGKVCCETDLVFLTSITNVACEN